MGEPGHWFVQQQQMNGTQEHHCNGERLAFSSRKQSGSNILASFKHRKGVYYGTSIRPAFCVTISRRQVEVFLDGQSRKGVPCLSQVSNPPANNSVGFEVGNIFAAKPYSAGTLRNLGRHGSHKSGLPAAVWSDQCHAFTFADDERQFRQNRTSTVTGAQFLDGQ